MITDDHSKGVVSVVEASPHPSKSVTQKDSLLFVNKESSPTENRQNLRKMYYPNGALYIFSIEDFYRFGDVPIQGCSALEMDKIASLDIDSALDLHLARLVWAHEQQSNN
jgi:N-acylneuraminate cytidylyltransferase